MNLVKEKTEPGTEASALQYEFGYSILGPVFHQYLVALNSQISYLDDDNTVFLFCSRAGVRIRELYQIFLDGRHLLTEGSEDKLKLFWVSRIAGCKGCFGDSTEEMVIKTIGREYWGQTLEMLLRGVLPEDLSEYHTQDDEELNQIVDEAFLLDWFKRGSFNAQVLKRYFADSSSAFEKYLETLVDDKGRIALIDSGWQGTLQSLCARAYPEYDWKGLYFGRILTPSHDSSISDNVIGLLFQSEKYRTDQPITALVEFRHLIETVLEPNGESIEEVYHGKFKKIVKPKVEFLKSNKIVEAKDTHFIAVRDYLKDKSKFTMREILSNYQRVLPILEQKILFPSFDDIAELRTKARSADFGKKFSVPVLQQPLTLDDRTSKDRVKSALWPQGQIALEYTDKGLARKHQEELLGLNISGDYFAGGAAEATSLSAAQNGVPRVAIITRTKDRPILLKRAAQSVANQSFKDYVWVVVNDGGNAEDAIKAIQFSEVDLRKVKFVHNETSLGMEAASNLGINSVDSDLIIIHDDDDSLEPNYLTKTVEFLDSPKGSIYGGAITKTTYVSEEISNDEVIIHGRYEYNSWVRGVELAEMFRGNFFAPICFIFRRDIFNKVGGYNESLPVLGDWYFNIEFLLHSDIAYVNEPLANYHHRDRSTTGADNYSNSVIGGMPKHLEYTPVFRNSLLRKYANNTVISSGLMNGYFATGLRHDINQAVNNVEARIDIEEIRVAIQNELQNTHSNLNQLDPADAESQPEDLRSVLLEFDLEWVKKQFQNQHGSNKSIVFWKNRWLRKLRAANWDSIWQILPSDFIVRAPDNFDEKKYLEINQDVASKIAEFSELTAYDHFVRYGILEGRERTTV